jgi:hypothetical protein
MQAKRAGRPRSERDRDIRKNFAIVEEPLERLRDEVARQDVHSRVDAAVRERLAETARRLVERLSPKTRLTDKLFVLNSPEELSPPGARPEEDETRAKTRRNSG